MVAGLWNDKDPKLVGARIRFGMRIVLISITVIFCGFGAARSAGTDIPDEVVYLWLAPSAAAFAAQVICRSPARRVPELGWIVFLAALLSTIFSLPGMFIEPDPVVGLTAVLGVSTLALSYAWRDRKEG